MRMVLSALDTYAATLFLVVSLSIFGRKLYLRIRYLFLAKGKESRWDHVPTRVKNFIVYGIFQRKVAREWYAGVLHSFIFWAFVILGASVVEITAQAYSQEWQVPTPTIAGEYFAAPPAAFRTRNRRDRCSCGSPWRTISAHTVASSLVRNSCFARSVTAEPHGSPRRPPGRRRTC